MESAVHTYGPYELFPFQGEACWGGNGYPGVLPLLLGDCPSCIVTMATGTGKTIVMGAVAAEWKKARGRGARVLMVCEQNKLIDQGYGKFSAMGLEVGIEQGDCTVIDRRPSLFGAPPDYDITVASMQTLDHLSAKGTRHRLSRFDPSYFDVVEIDECHRSVTKRYSRLRSHFREAKFVGFTGTPERSDGRDLGKVFERIAYEFPLWAAIDGKWLKKIKVKRVMTDIDLGLLRVAGRDYTDAEIADVIKPYLRDMVALFVRYYQGRKALLFCADVETSRMASQFLRDDHGIAAEAVWGKGSRGMTEERQKDILSRYHRGALRCLTANRFLMEGYDEDTVECVGIMRPTLSELDFIQMVGRGTRYLAGVPDMLLLDFAYASEAHRFVQPTVLYARPDRPDEVLDLAQSMIDEGLSDDIEEAVADAEKTFYAAQEKKSLGEYRKLRHQIMEYDPMQMLDHAMGLKVYKYDYDREHYFPANGRQIAQLREFGIKDAHLLTYKGAKRRLLELQHRQMMGLASHEQVASLIKLGVPGHDARNMDAHVAARELHILGARSVSYRPGDATQRKAKR